MAESVWAFAAAALTTGVMAGLIFWACARVALFVADRWPARAAFAHDLLAGPGEHDRRRHRAVSRELGTVLAALLSGLLAAAGVALLAPVPPSLPDWLWMVVLVLALAGYGGAVYYAARLSTRRRRIAFEWAAKAAIGNILKRLNLGGNAVYHDVVTETSTIDHVVVGRKGVFALNVVARPLPKTGDSRPSVELKHGKLWMAGIAEALPVGEAARNMTLLSGTLSKTVGHRVPVRSVLVVPGWHSVPDGGGNHLVLNEGNLAMLTSWNTPDAYLMDEDCVAIQTALHEASRLPRLV